ncbi:hypothetical protein vseg_017598 [Gypsophila vaccaria]
MMSGMVQWEGLVSGWSVGVRTNKEAMNSRRSGGIGIGGNGNGSRRRRSWRVCKPSLITNPESFQVGRFLGTYGFFNVTSTSSNFRTPELGQGTVTVIQGQLRGTSVLFKVYPGLRATSPDADLMASNELSTYSFLHVLSLFSFFLPTYALHFFSKQLQ